MTESVTSKFRSAYEKGIDGPCVASSKLFVWSLSSFQPRLQRLSFGTRPLQAHCLVADYNIVNESILNLMLDLRGGADVKTKEAAEVKDKLEKAKLADLVQFAQSVGVYDESMESAQQLRDVIRKEQFPQCQVRFVRWRVCTRSVVLVRRRLSLRTHFAVTAVSATI